MTPTPYYEKSLFARTLDHEARFAAMTEHLPIREDATPYHSGPHSLRAMEAAFKLCGEPHHILEVGFCLGHSASVWFGLGATRVTSIENSTRPQTLDSARKMKDLHGAFFRFLATTSDKLMDREPPSPYGMMFIDGGHEFADVSADVALALKWKIPFLLFDDWFPKWGPGTQPAVEHHNLIPLAIFGNMALCVPSDGWKYL